MKILLHFTGPPMPITARMHSKTQRPFPFSHPVSNSPHSPTSLPFGPASIIRVRIIKVLSLKGRQNVSRAQGESSGRKWGTGQGGEKRGRETRGVECTLAVFGTGGPVK